MSATRSALPGEIRAYADANKREQGRGIVVEAVERHPGDTAILGGGPLGQQRRLAVARRRRDPDHPALARPGRLDEIVTTHGPRTRLRHRELGVEQHLIERDGRASTWAEGPARSHRRHARHETRPRRVTGPISRNLRDATASSSGLDQKMRSRTPSRDRRGDRWCVMDARPPSSRPFGVGP